MNELIKEYLNRGFGSMNKNDFEVAIFNYLLESGWSAKTNRAISLELKIPETKVRRLRYEAELKYGNNTDDEFNKKLYEVLKNTNFKHDGKKLVFVMENQMIRNYLDGKLKEMGNFSDRSFNSEVVSVDAKDFISLLKALEMDDDVIKKAKNKSLMEALTKIAGKIADYSLPVLLELLTK